MDRHNLVTVSEVDTFALLCVLVVVFIGSSYLSVNDFCYQSLAICVFV